MDSVAESIIRDVRAKADPERASTVSRYMKTSSLRFLGVAVTEVRRITRSRTRNLTSDELLFPMDDLWPHRVFEYRIAAITAMESYSAKGDVATAFGIISRWVEDADTWSITDPLCVVCLGSLIIRDRTVEDRIAEWRNSKNVWRRRAAVLPYLHLSKKSLHRPEFNERILSSMSHQIDDNDFFVAKAVGWVLRELSRRAPEVVSVFVDENREKMARLTLKEACRALNREGP